jgi:hypothetical protein
VTVPAEFRRSDRGHDDGERRARTHLQRGQFRCRPQDWGARGRTCSRAGVTELLKLDCRFHSSPEVTNRLSSGDQTTPQISRSANFIDIDRLN